MTLRERISRNETFLMEGALSERLKREYQLDTSNEVAMASLVYQKAGRDALRTLWLQYLTLANEYNLPFLATTPTRRANRERVKNGGYSESIIRDNVIFIRNVLSEIDHLSYIGGLMGCKGDAYTGKGNLPEEEAYEFHSWQAKLFEKAGIDFLYAGIMPTLPETVGIARAMAETGLPYIISFTIRPDGCLIDSTPISTAIEIIDAKINPNPLCYMTNCVHPRFAGQALEKPFNATDTVRKRFKGIQANTAAFAYKAIDGSDILQVSSSPENLATDMRDLQRKFGLEIFGGCCGTDDTYMREIAKAVISK